jgi:hypothetical protein
VGLAYMIFYQLFDIYSLSIETYAAWCRNNGIHSTRSQKYTNWNEEIISGMNETMDDKWNRYRRQVHTLMKDFEQRVQETMEKFAQHLAGAWNTH